MKLTKLASLFSLGFALLIGNSCNEKNIDLQPLTPTEASFFIEEADFDKSIIAVYAKLTDWYWFAANNPIHGFWHLPGDDITSSGTYAFEIFGTLQPSNGEINSFYRTAYQLINRANTTLEKLAQETGVLKDATKKNSLKGEALFLRGYANFQLWNYFGTSPLMIERITSTDKITPPNSKDTELVDQAIKDFTDAAGLVPAKWDDANRGRITQNAANGMLGKALLFRGSIKKNAADFTAALAAFNKISGATLTANFMDNFSSKVENNSESLFEFQATQPAFDNVWLNNDFDNNIGSTSAYWGWYENHFSLFGKAFFQPTRKLLDAFEKGDPRRAITADSSGKMLRKYWATDDQKSQSGVASVNNPRILRLADVLLLKAEATLESGGSTAEAIALINQVRTRARAMKAGGTAPANYASTETDKTKIFNWIANERFLELAGEEGHRWLDLRRWHLAGKLNLAGWNWSSLRNDVSFDPAKHLYYPIPTSELDNNVNVRQNPGY
ncbi:MAG: RagB/SusD family nutrient uptake outer membrane protein [Cytophagaceae bacterium]|nr:RagB/SusD family nutrient uptake outer membrane protein [Cytophagaceae bacterium]